MARCRDATSCIFYGSKHAGGICLGTIQARTHVQLALACQQSLLKVQHRLRFTMQHVCGHTGNLGNECADHAAALGALGLVSSHNFSTRWALHSFDSASCIASCSNLGDVLEKVRDIRTDMVSTSQHPNKSSRFVLQRVLCSSQAYTAPHVFISQPFLSCSLSQSFVVLYVCHGWL